MATVINNPSSGDDAGGAGVIIGVIVGVIIVIALIFYAVPALRGQGGNADNSKPINVDLNLGAGGTGGNNAGGGAPSGGGAAPAGGY